MSGGLSTKCSKSASEGNLADCEDEGSDRGTMPAFRARSSFASSSYGDTSLLSAFSTLPRRMGSEKKIKRKQLKREDRYERMGEPPCPTRPSKIPKSQSSDGFFVRLFRQFGAFKQLPTQTNSALPTPPPPPAGRSRLLSASNTDIRSLPPPPSSDAIESHQDPPGGWGIGDQHPALCGLRNHGNTCFMNAVLQCLSNTDPFAEYFVLDQYKVDQSRRNKIHAKKYGTKGEVTEHLAVLLKALWSCQYAPEISSRLKASVAKFGPQYQGSQQHDAQEFLLWLLDKVHEDLNIATKKKYKKPKNSQGRHESEVAAETLSNYRRCNNSFVQDLFQAQFRSSLSCPSCKKSSNTFDPYLCVSLPLPHVQKRNVLVRHANAKDQQQHQFSLQLDFESTTRELRSILASEHGVLEQKCILMNPKLEGLAGSPSLLDTLSIVPSEVCLLELPRLNEVVSESQEERIVLVWINRITSQAKSQIFGSPFAAEISREATYAEIQEKMLERMAPILKSNIPKTDLGVLFKLRIANSFVAGGCLLSHEVDHPLYMTSVQQTLEAMADLEAACGPPHLSLLVEWDQDTKSILVNEEMVTSNNLAQDKDVKSSLHQCFQLYFMEEKLGLEDAWMCPTCKRREQGTKKLSLWTTPDIFIIHLKRFRQSSSTQRTKLTTNVDFPTTGLDVSQYVQRKAIPVGHGRQDANNLLASSTLGTVSSWSPWRPYRSSKHRDKVEDCYDLYAVCNHHGSMQGGHYDAFCKNPVDGRWYHFDDLKVKPVSHQSEVVTSDAYILFYQRSTMSSSCASSSSSGYSSASNGSLPLVNLEHWAYRMPPFHRWSACSRGSQSQDNLCDYEAERKTTAKLGPGLVAPFERTQRAYASLMPSSTLGPTRNQSSCNTSYELDHHSDEESLQQQKRTASPSLAHGSSQGGTLERRYRNHKTVSSRSRESSIETNMSVASAEMVLSLEDNSTIKGGSDGTSEEGQEASFLEQRFWTITSV